jgi:hypothetical protein
MVLAEMDSVSVFERKQFSNSSIGRFMFDLGKRRRSVTNLRPVQEIRSGAVLSTATALRTPRFERGMEGFRTPND